MPNRKASTASSTGTVTARSATSMPGVSSVCQASYRYKPPCRNISSDPTMAPAEPISMMDLRPSRKLNNVRVPGVMG